LSLYAVSCKEWLGDYPGMLTTSSIRDKGNDERIKDVEWEQ
jgi:hypothetical protein